MGRQAGDQSRLFYLFNLEDRIPSRHMLRRINPVVTRVLGELRAKLQPFYSETGRPSIHPEHPFRAQAVRGARTAPRRSLVLPPRSRRQGPGSLDVLSQSPRSLPRRRHLPAAVRGGGHDVHGRGAGQGRRVRCRRQRYGSRCQPLSRQGAGRDRLDGAPAPDTRGSRVPRRCRRRSSQCGSHAAEGDLAERSLLRVDGQGQPSACSSAMGSIISSTSKTR
jgi:hypothetical protein